MIYISITNTNSIFNLDKQSDKGIYLLKRWLYHMEITQTTRCLDLHQSLEGKYPNAIHVYLEQYRRQSRP